ncbi:MAG: hypothetical protein GX600_08545 [Dehalococcoidia bacterium]|nr:hypothetical protein [Dehalococcoidia bacterium]
MTIAELHGKLAEGRTSGYEYMEDLLTSDVFGTMRYAGWKCGFLDWLLRAQAAPVDPSPPPVESVLRPSALLEIEHRFWPRLNNGREPDLALLLWYDSGPAVLAVVEAKYLSGMSDYENGAPENEDALTGDQILDQVQGIETMSPHALLEWFEDESVSPDELTEVRKIHLLVTAHSMLPVDVYKRSVSKRRRPWPPCYWLSWTSLADCLEPYLDQLQGGTKALVDDLHRLLSRKGLVRFRGFHITLWRPAATAPSFWREQWWSEAPWHNTCSAPSFWHERRWAGHPWRSQTSAPTFWGGKT